MNELLLNDVLGTIFSDIVPYMNDIWHDKIKMSKTTCGRTKFQLFLFEHLSLCF